MKRVLTGVLSVVLATAVGLQVFAALRPLRDRVPDKALRAQLPAVLPGWRVEDQLIAESEEMKRAVGELLNFDDAIFRSYRRGGSRFDVYVAYWRPGKMSQRLVAGHTPDVCWVQSGWGMLEHEHGKIFRAGGRDLAPAQYRLFDDGRGGRQHVVFWHLAGGQVVAYDVARTPPWWSALGDLVKYGFDQRRAQYFIRISSPEPLDGLWTDADFQRVLKTLGPLGIAGGRAE